MARANIDKLRAVAIEYTTNGYNKVEALKKAGYKDSYARSVGLQLYDDIRLKDLIAKCEAKKQVKMDITLNEVIANARWLVDRGKQDDDKASVKAGNEQLGRIIGAYTDRLVTDKSNEPEPLTQADKDKLKAMAKQLTNTIKLDKAV